MAAKQHSTAAPARARATIKIPISVNCPVVVTVDADGQRSRFHEAVEAATAARGVLARARAAGDPERARAGLAWERAMDLAMMPAADLRQHRLKVKALGPVWTAKSGLMGSIVRADYLRLLEEAVTHG